MMVTVQVKNCEFYFLFCICSDKPLLPELDSQLFYYKKVQQIYLFDLSNQVTGRYIAEMHRELQPSFFFQQLL